VNGLKNEGNKGEFCEIPFYRKFDTAFGAGILKGLDVDKVDTDSTYILVRNDFDVLDMASCLKDLTKNILSDPRIKASNV
jgi:hypothetical protein